MTRATRLLAILLFATAAYSQPADTRGAMAWATETRNEVFARAFPPGDSDVITMPVCRVTTLRSSGAVDVFEYSIRIEEACDTVDPYTGRLAKGEVSGEFTISSGAPLAVQLAKLKAGEPQISVDEAAAKVKVAHIPLSRKQALATLRALDRLKVSVLPSTTIAMDSPFVELISATAASSRRIGIASNDRPEDKAAIAIGTGLAAQLGYPASRLLYDESTSTQQ